MGNAAFVEQFLEMMPCSGNGKNLKLLPWERDAVRQFYNPVEVDEWGNTVRERQYLYVELPKKNGKSEFAGGLGLYHLMADGENKPEVYLVAADKANAGIVFDVVLYMIRHQPDLMDLEKNGILRVVESMKLIEFKPNNGFLKVLSSEAYSKHGYKPSCVIFDELHAQPNRELWDVMTFGAGDARLQPVWIVLTTAGDDPDRQSIGWEVHEKAMKILQYRERYLVPGAPKPPPLGEADDDGLYENTIWTPIIYGISRETADEQDAIEELDIYDEKLWFRCNPSLGKTIKLSSVRREAREAKLSEAKERLFRWLRLNQWIATKSVGWIPLTIYDKTQWNGDPETLVGKKCFAGVDLSTTTDLTAVVLLFPPQEGLDVWVKLPMAWRPKDTVIEAEKRDHVPYRKWEQAGFLRLCEGDMVDFEDILQYIRDASLHYNIKLVGVDPYLSRMLSPQLQAEWTDEDGATHSGLNVAEIRQTIAGMSPAMKVMEQHIRAHQMLHVHNTCARWCFGNLRCQEDGNANLKPMKNKSTGRIDITVAWIIAMAASMSEGGPDWDTETLPDDWSL